MLNIFCYSCVYNRETWMGGIYSSHRLDGPCEDQVIGHEPWHLLMSMCLISIMGKWNK